MGTARINAMLPTSVRTTSSATNSPLSVTHSGWSTFTLKSMNRGSDAPA